MKDLREGLLQTPKKVPFKYLYDEAGSRIFSSITDLPEYYLTACERSILARHATELMRELPDGALRIVELGAGDGRKIGPLLQAAARKGPVTYVPVDISESALAILKDGWKDRFPEIGIEPRCMDFLAEGAKLPRWSGEVHLFLYLGSSIGNFLPSEQDEFFGFLRSQMGERDFLLTGFDLRKDPALLRAAYDDSRGLTREFNKNLLVRLNREWKANFQTGAFRHEARYNADSGAMESWLVSLIDQRVEIPGLEMTLTLQQEEALHVETSWKFTAAEIEKLAEAHGFRRLRAFSDSRAWFVDELWRPRRD